MRHTHIPYHTFEGLPQSSATPQPIAATVMQARVIAGQVAAMPRRRWSARFTWATAVTMLAIMWITSGCAAADRTTQLTTQDLRTMTERMAASLLVDADVAAIMAAGEPMVVTLDRVSNFTNDIMPNREKWLFMARLRSQLTQTPAMSQRGMQFVLPQAWAASLSDRHGDVFTERTGATHALAATFYASTELNRERRRDTYLCTFQLIDLKTDGVIWEDSFEVVRAAVRNRFD